MARPPPESLWPARIAILAVIGLNPTNLSSLARRVISLLASVINIWVTTSLVFSLWYWEMDRGGPLRRGLAGNAPDVLFPQLGLAPTMPL